LLLSICFYQFYKILYFFFIIQSKFGIYPKKSDFLFIIISLHEIDLPMISKIKKIK